MPAHLHLQRDRVQAGVQPGREVDRAALVTGGGEWQASCVDVVPVDAESPEKVLRIEDKRRGVKARELKLLNEDE